jgi:hypothetical protein
MIKESKYRTLSVNKETYNLVKEKQLELIKKNNGNYVELSYIADSAILIGLSEVV